MNLVFLCISLLNHHSNCSEIFDQIIHNSDSCEIFEISKLINSNVFVGSLEIESSREFNPEVPLVLYLCKDGVLYDFSSQVNEKGEFLIELEEGSYCFLVIIEGGFVVYTGRVKISKKYKSIPLELEIRVC
ncbi:MAG: hypothetical protein H6510_04490 [Acidobacteria bacterium]|nr:hypothetical protein [Acidobacteriota bacterium]